MGRPIAYLSGLRTLVQEEAPGISLHDIFLGEDEVTSAVRKTARTLAVLHLGDVGTPQRRLPWKENEVATLEEIGKSLRRACPHLSPEIEEIVGVVVADLEEAPTTPTHGDLHLQNILIASDRPAILDLGTFSEADPLLDMTRLLAFLANAPCYSPVPHDRARKASQAFVEEYFAHDPEVWRDRLPFRYAGAVLKMAGATFRLQGPSWSDTVEALVKEAKDSLAGEVW